MRSRVDARRIAEWVLRVVSITILIALLMRVWERTAVTASVDSGAGSHLSDLLPRWTVTRFARIHMELDSEPTQLQREWLAAIRHAGTRLSWNSSKVVPLAGALTELADPAGSSELDISAPPGDTIVVTDTLAGLLDTVVAREGGATITVPGVVHATGFSVNGGMGRAAMRDSVVFKRLLVEGSASWETKFTIAALSERGWQVDALTHVAPGVDVRAGNPGAPDTSRYAAVIAIDSSAALIASGAARYVRNGGGLITLRDAASVGPPAVQAVVLERRTDGDVRAYRVGGGRVVRAGYKDIWRARMSGDDTESNPVAQHRAWLARAVAAVAYAPRLALALDSAADPAPFASLVDAIGAPSRIIPADMSGEAEVPSAALFAVLVASLMMELLSRRLRGRR